MGRGRKGTDRLSRARLKARELRRKALNSLNPRPEMAGREDFEFWTRLLGTTFRNSLMTLLRKELRLDSVV
jgi:hypothetical protein